jgi:ABC-type arginine transport system permease subunit
VAFAASSAANATSETFAWTVFAALVLVVVRGVAVPVVQIVDVVAVRLRDMAAGRTVDVRVGGVFFVC